MLLCSYAENAWNNISDYLVGLYHPLCQTRYTNRRRKRQHTAAFSQCNPPRNSVNFDAEKVVMVFDEYIKLNDITNQLIVSPPMERSSYRILPEGTVSKKVEIRFETPPRDNTTFTFNFGEAIEDFNEANPPPLFLLHVFYR